MQKNLFASFASLLGCAALAVALTTSVQAADAKVDGKWSWTMQGRGGNANATPRKSTLTLKQDGEKLTGTLSQPAFGRRGQGGDAPAPVETAISDGKIKGSEISFKVTREFNGNSRTTTYNGKVDGDTIKGKVEMPGRNGGDPISRDWEAKREK
jgi:hypothetical protein